MRKTKGGQLLSNTSNRESLTAKIDALLSENRAVPGMAKYGDDAMLQSNLFCSLYDWDDVAEQYKDLFKEVMNHVGQA